MVLGGYRLAAVMEKLFGDKKAKKNVDTLVKETKSHKSHNHK